MTEINLRTPYSRVRDYLPDYAQQRNNVSVKMLWATALLALPAVITIGSLFATPVALAGYTHSIVALLMVTLLAEVAVIILAFLVNRIPVNWYAFMFNRIRGREAALALSIGVGLFVLLQVIVNAVVAAFPQLEITSSNTSTEIAQTTGIGRFVTMWILAPVVIPLIEELLFRVVVCSSIWRATAFSYNGRLVAIILSGLLFGISHTQGFSSASDLFLVLWTTVIGVVNAILLTKYHSIFMPFLVHFSYNLVTALTIAW